ncbi:heparinase II/III domain-containing protein [Ornithinimicrobium sp. Y1694]|uniref:heparinase II/III domain-containing protein n=1 Tax=Ornithinimicrobium sp. Y1694 TaxID=3418590 RepID=UPI003CF7BF68
MMEQRLDLKVAQRQGFAAVHRRPSDVEEKFAGLLAGKLSLPPHPTWEDANLTDWTADPFSDRNWQFQHHTLRWLEPARHLALDGNSRARGFWLETVRSWAERNTPPIKAPSEWAWKDMADGTRAIYLALGAPIAGADTPWYTKLMEEHRNWLIEPQNIVARNHGLHQNCGLLVASALLRDEEGKRVALARLTSQFKDTFDTQGVNDEGSFAYHQMNLIWWKEAWERVSQEGHAVPELVGARLSRAATVLAHMAYPNGELPQIGDSARGPVKLGLGPASDYAASSGTTGQPPGDLGVVFARGYAISRSGWGGSRGSDHSHLVLRFGHDLEAHSHQDRGSVHFYSGGVPWLVDPGFHNYQARDKIRAYTKSRESHNVILVPSAKYDRATEVRLEDYTVCEAYDDFRLADVGYDPLGATRRVVYFREPDCLLVIDSLESSQKMQQQWLLDEGILVSRHDRGLTLRRGNKIARMHWLGRLPSLRITPAQPGSLDGWIAPRWKTLIAGTRVRATVSPDGPPRISFLFAPPGESALSIHQTYVTQSGLVTAILSRGEQVWSIRVGDEVSVRLEE